MNGQMKNYNSYMEQAYTPVDVNSLPFFVDMRGLRDYAKKKGVPMSSLPENEMSAFIKENPVAKQAASL